MPNRFEVRATYSAENHDVAETDVTLFNAAKQMSSSSGCGIGLDNQPRDLGWLVDDFKEAIALKKKNRKSTTWRSAS